MTPTSANCQPRASRNVPREPRIVVLPEVDLIEIRACLRAVVGSGSLDPTLQRIAQRALDLVAVAR